MSDQPPPGIPQRALHSLGELQYAAIGATTTRDYPDPLSPADEVALLRWRALALDLASPPLAAMRAVHAMRIFGGVLGWVLGVLLRAGPMFVPGWSVPPRTARAIPWTLALGVLVTLAGETGAWRAATGTMLARLGELLALGTVAVIAISGGVFLIPVLELVALPWPRLRRVAFWALLGAVTLRTAELGAAYGAPAIGPLRTLPGVLVWVGVAWVAANLARAISAPRPHAASRGRA